jgi:hypothetical protein
MITIAELTDLVAQALDVDQVDENASMENIEQWDSLGHLSVLTLIDKHLEGKASTLAGLASATGVGEIAQILETNNLLEK